MLKVGDTAPAFSLADQEGNTVSLDSFRGQKVLLWFYPKASTPGCTAEGCNLRDNFAELKARNVAVLGMSKDTVKRQKNFATKQEFPYPLLSDEPGDVVQAYGCWGRKKFMGREYDGIFRKSFLIDEDGKIERIYEKVKTKIYGVDVLADL
jgi:peroxiredoxin Q/BCP